MQSPLQQGAAIQRGQPPETHALEVIMQKRPGYIIMGNTTQVVLVMSVNSWCTFKNQNVCTTPAHTRTTKQPYYRSMPTDEAPSGEK